MIRRLRIKFICINMVIVTTMLAAIFGTVFHFTRENLREQSIRSLTLAADDHRHPGRPGEFPERVMMPFFTVELLADGTVSHVRNTFFDLSDETLVQNLVQIVCASEEKQGVITGYQLRYNRLITPNGQKITFLDISSEIATVKNLFETCVLLGTVSFVVFLGISILLSHWAIRPVETAWNQQKQFVADASHELKTPLTVIMTNAELLQDSSYTPQERAQFSESILVMSRQMRGLVESLLELARADNGTQKMDFEAFDFSALVNDSLLLFEPVYFEKGLTLESEVQEGLRVTGSRTHLKQVLEILLDNGVKYAAPGTMVKLTLQQQGSRSQLSVASRGEAISKEDLLNIFKRFYRIDKARSMDGSYGLGLSIAQSVVNSHGGKIWAESSEGINTFFVQL